MTKQYIHTGQCIWCKRKKPDVTFYTAPHITTHSLGANEIGVDICDDCNHFFGTALKGMPNTNLVFKEVFQASQCSLGERPKIKTKYSYVYFHYDRTTDKIKLKSVLLAEKVYSKSNYAKIQNGSDDIVLSSSEILNDQIISTARENNINVLKSVVYCSDAF